MDEKLEELLNHFPFLSYGKMGEDHYLGIVQNSDPQLTSMYVIDFIPTPEMRADFLNCGSEWWWGSNRMIPINIFLKDRFTPYRCCLRHFSSKDFELLAGHSVSLHDAIVKRKRRRQITMVRMPDLAPPSSLPEQ